MNNNLHIALGDFQNASRILKITRSLLSEKIMDNIFIAALHSDGLQEEESYSENYFIKRFVLNSRGLRKTLFFQIFKYIEFYKQLVAYYYKKSINVINIHDVFMLPIGVLLKKRFKAMLVYDTHELETEKNISKIRTKISKYLEKRNIKHCDLIVVVTDPIADWYQTMYKIKRPTVILNTPHFLRKQKKSDFFREYLSIPKDWIIVLYQGALFRGRGIELLLETFTQYKIEKTAMVFMGFGTLEERIKTASAHNDNIYFHPAVSPDIVLNYTSSADIGISPIEYTCLNEYYCLPNKLFEYIQAGLPVIVSNLQEMARVVNENNIGEVIEGFTPEALKKAIEKIKAMNYDDLCHNVEKIKKQYSWESQEKILIPAYRSLLERKQKRG